MEKGKIGVWGYVANFLYNNITKKYLLRREQKRNSIATLHLFLLLYSTYYLLQAMAIEVQLSAKSKSKSQDKIMQKYCFEKDFSNRVQMNDVHFNVHYITI